MMGVGFIAVIVLFLLVVLSHEFGHYFVARAFGVKVLTFSIGFGPVLWKRLIGETEWRICAALIGGQVRMLGEGPSDAVPEAERHRSFMCLNPWKKCLVVVAGAVGNILLAVVIFAFLYTSGVKLVAAEIGAVEAGSAGEAAGLRQGDVVVSAGGSVVRSWPKFTGKIEESAEMAVQLVVRRGDNEVEVVVVPKKKTIVDALKRSRDVGYLGVSPSGRTVVVREDIVSAISSGVRECWKIVSLVAIAIFRLVTGYLPASSMAGPIMIVKTVSEQASVGLQNFLYVSAFISINLGVFNLLPMLPFDGGFLAFFAYEGVSGRAVSERFMGIAQRVGVLFVFLLLALVVYNDLIAVFFGGGK